MYRNNSIPYTTLRIASVKVTEDIRPQVEQAVRRAEEEAYRESTNLVTIFPPAL
jgi:hypothetical protein